jgi:hypothetical protein
MSRRARPEDIIQKTVFQHIALRGVPGLVGFHVPQGNKLGGKRNKRGIPIQGSINRSLGVKAGVSDIIAFYDGQFFALELKSPGSTPTDAQLEFIEKVRAAGGKAGWVEGLDRALVVLERWGLLKGRTL